MLGNIGLTVAREIPGEALWGVVTGAYKVHGGVIRDAGGKIVAHLVSSGAASGLTSLIPGAGLLADALQAGQLWKLSKDVAQVQLTLSTVLTVATAGTAISGLGLVTSIAGFVYLSRRLKEVDIKLNAIQQDVKGVKDWLHGLQKSQLQFAIDNVRHAGSVKDEALRRDMLLQSKRDFSTLAHHYRDQWSRCKTVLEIQAVDDLYTLAILGSATVCSDLGLGTEAAADLRSNWRDWAVQARQHAKSMLFDERPDKLLGAEYVGKLPARTLIGLLDFAHDTERGVDWMDDLRLEQGKHRSVFDGFASSPTARLQDLNGKGDSDGFVDVARALSARSNIMEANVAHYEFLNENDLIATSFQAELESARQNAAADAVCVFRR